jgi:hypothetical protein
MYNRTKIQNFMHSGDAKKEHDSTMVTQSPAFRSHRVTFMHFIYYRNAGVSK